MNWKSELKILAWLTALFLIAFYMPVDSTRFHGAVWEGLHMVRWYAREHVILCLVPAYFIAGAISIFVSQASIMKYLGPGARPVTAYGVASVSGSVLAVCSCTVLPLFGGIYRRGAGLGPAIAFLYSGPAINVLAIVMTARVLGLNLGLARVVGAVAFSLLAGAIMHQLFKKEESDRMAAQPVLPAPPGTRPLRQTVAVIAGLVAVLVFANWGAGGGRLSGAICNVRWVLTALSAMGLGTGLVVWYGLAWRKLIGAGLATLVAWAIFPDQPMWAFLAGSAGLGLATATSPGELRDWFSASWDFAKQVTPLLLGGVLVAGFLLGRPGHEGLIPSAWVASLVGGNGILSNLFASLVGAFMYFATLTEVPILQGLLGSGMGKGPALALLLAGPAMSLPSMLVLQQLMGTKKTVAYVGVVAALSTLAGWLYGLFF